MHTLMLVVGGLVALGIFVLAAVLLGKRVADGARVFVWSWLAASVINMERTAGSSASSRASSGANTPKLERRKRLVKPRP